MPIKKVYKHGLKDKEVFETITSKQFRALIENSSDAIVLNNKEGKITYASPSIKRILGYFPKEIIGQSPANFIHPEDHDKTLTSFKKTLHNPKYIAKVYYRLKHKKYGWRWVEAVMSNFLNDNSISAVVINLRDIHAQREAEEKLLQSEERFRTLSVKAPVGIFQTDKDGNCVFVNKRWSEISGMTPKSAYGQGWVQALHPDDKERVFREWYESARKKKEFLSEYRFKTKKGRISWLHGSAVAIHDANGNEIGFIGTIVDITENKRFEEQIQETSNLLKTILDTAPIGFCLFDKNLRYQMINNMLAEFNGISPEKHIGKTIQEIIPSITEEATKELKTVLKTGRPILGLELTGGTKVEPNKIKHWLEDYFPVRSISGEIIGVGALVIDITERKQQERQRDEFLGIASHELKTPVTSLKAFGQVLQKRFAQEGNEKSVELVGKMDAQINKLTNLISDLLDISKIEGGRLQFRNDNFSFDNLVIEIIEEIQRTTHKHKIILKGRTGKIVFGDRDRIGQVITNFLTNAIKYSPYTEKILVKVSSKNNNVELITQDFGIGIPKESLNHIFERFYRVKSNEHDTIPGMGLGLNISSEIIKRLGGEIGVSSTHGKGSSFSFTLPIKRSK